MGGVGGVSKVYKLNRKKFSRGFGARPVGRPYPGAATAAGLVRF